MLNQLEKEGLVEIITPTVQGVRSFRLTNEGQQAGNEVLGEFPEPIQQYIRDVVNFVRSLSFAELVSAIYQAYPEMKVNSVFAEAK